MSDAAQLVAALRDKGWLMATAESCTGGLIAAAITDVAGASDVFDRGYVTYSNAAKSEMLGVDPATIARVGAVSEEVAAEMAMGARRSVDLAISVTGIAGPGGSEFKPEGRVCFGLATRQGVHTETLEFGAIGRKQVRQASVVHALGLILGALQP